MHATDPRFPDSYIAGQQKWSSSIGTGWIGMGKSAPQNQAKPSLWSSISFMVALLALLLRPACCQQCRIHRCNTEYVASTSPSSGLQEEAPADLAYCIALRAYSLCTRRTARSCRGDLVYHSAVFRIKELFSQHNCSSDGPTSAGRAPSTARAPASALCDYEGRARAYEGPGGQHRKYAHCGLFGDPHLRTFRDEFQTCKVEGAWPLIHNKYLSVQVTNTPVLPGSSATATSKLTIIFKNSPECVDQKTYHAETDELPAAFADGSRNGGERHGANALRVVEKVPGQHVEIQARYIGTTIVVRQVGRYLTFAVRMPEEVATAAEDGDNQDLYLCLHGCPLNQRIDFRAPRGWGPGPPPHGFTYQSATAKCRERLPVEDLYFQSCVFDLLSSGDVNFTLAAYYAFEDAKMLHSNKDRYHIFESPRSAGSSAYRGSSLPSLAVLFFLALLPWMRCCGECL